MSGGEVLVQALKVNGIKTLFGLPGVQLDHFFNALHDDGTIRVINARHEQSTAYMALGHALATGQPSAYAVVPGPGILNTAAALSTAYGCNAPVLAISGQIPANYIGRDMGMLHEIPDQLGILERLTKWAGRAEHASEIAHNVARAFQEMNSGRRRPAALEVPLDVLAQKIIPQQAIHRGVHREPPELDEDLIAAAAEKLAQAKCPLIVVGGGALDAGDSLQNVAERLSAPVISHRMGHGALSSRHPLSANQLVGNRLWKSADVVLAVGTRLQHQQMVWGVDDDLSIIRIDIDPTQISRLARPAVGIVGDAAQVLEVLADKLSAMDCATTFSPEEITSEKNKVAKILEENLPDQMAYLGAIRRALPEDGILVDEFTQVGYVARVGFPVYAPRTLINSSYQGTLGYGYATALGVQVAAGKRRVLSINGDGGFLFTGAEMATAVLHDIPLTAVVFNDGAYGNVKRMQTNLYGNRVIASNLHNPDFVRYAESFGAMGIKVDSPEGLESALSKAFAANRPVLIECMVGAMPDPWKYIAPGRVRKRRLG